MGETPRSLATIFVSQPAVYAGLPGVMTDRHFATVRNTRNLLRKDMIRNTSVPKVDVPEDGSPVLIDDRPAALAPTAEVPLGQRYHFA